MDDKYSILCQIEVGVIVDLGKSIIQSIQIQGRDAWSRESIDNRTTNHMKSTNDKRTQNLVYGN